MSVSYCWRWDFEVEEVRELFLSVEWDSGNHPERVCRGLRGSHGVASAWDGERLVGLASVLCDGAMVAYVPYLVVHPRYQRRGVGATLMGMVKTRYADMARVVLVSYDDTVDFYQRQGFGIGEGKTPMYVTWLKT